MSQLNDFMNEQTSFLNLMLLFIYFMPLLVLLDGFAAASAAGLLFQWQYDSRWLKLVAAVPAIIAGIAQERSCILML